MGTPNTAQKIAKPLKLCPDEQRLLEIRSHQTVSFPCVKMAALPGALRLRPQCPLLAIISASHASASAGPHTHSHKGAMASMRVHGSILSYGMNVML